LTLFLPLVKAAADNSIRRDSKMDATAPVNSGRQDMKILGLISTGHFMSHFYFLTLPPLFPFLRDAFGVSYTELGLMMTAIYSVSGLAQVPVGFVVDRIGARIVLTVGLVLMSLGFGLAALVPSFWAIIPLVMIAAAGHSVFHPADYAILNASISPGRMGRAFSIHTFAGHLGSAMAPVSMIFIAGLIDWRAALLVAGLIGLVVLAALSTQWGALHDDALYKKRTDKPEAGSAAGAEPGGFALLLSRPMILFFLFFAAISMTSTGMQAFSVSALVALHDTPVTAASTALTVYLFSTAAGILVGGQISDRTERHDLLAAFMFVLTIIFMLVLATISLPLAGLFALMVVMGVGQGIVRPARDMMLRAAAPRSSMGKVFGFVSAGIAAGSAIAPIPFGMILDAGRPQWVFYLIAIFMLVALITVMLPKKQPETTNTSPNRRASPAAPSSAPGSSSS
jgi:MFS family permease